MLDNQPTTQLLDLLMKQNKIEILNWHYEDGSVATVDNSDIFLGILLAFHPRIQKFVNSTRNKLGIKTHNLKMESKSPQELFCHIKYDEKLETELKEFINRYQLDEHLHAQLGFYIQSGWIIVRPSEIAFISGGFPLPSEVDNEKVNENLNAGSRVFARYPSIHITRKPKSFTEFSNWLKDHWVELEKNFTAIPEQFKNKASLERFTIGIWLWNLRDINGLSWDEIMKKIDQLEEEDPNFFGDDDNRIYIDRSKGPDYIYSAIQTMKTFLPF